MTSAKKNGSSRRFTPKEDRQAKHIKESEEKRGHSEEDAEGIANSTVNKQRVKRSIRSPAPL